MRALSLLLSQPTPNRSYKPPGAPGSELDVVQVDFYNDIASYLTTFLAANPNNINSLDDIVEWNKAHASSTGAVPGVHPCWPSGQDLLEASAATKGVEDEKYHATLAYLRRKSREEGIDSALKDPGDRAEPKQDEREEASRAKTPASATSSTARVVDESAGSLSEFDALLVPIQADGQRVVSMAAKAGYPMITLPVSPEDARTRA